MRQEDQYDLAPDIQALKPWLVVDQPDAAGEWAGRCPLHDDGKASASFNFEESVWNCFVCDGDGPIGKLLHQLEEEGVDTAAWTVTAKGDRGGFTADVVDLNAHRRQKGARLPLAATVEGWHSALLSNSQLMGDLARKRGLTRETIERLKIGWNVDAYQGPAFVIPIFNEAKKIANVKFYRMDPEGEQRKMWGITGHNEARLYPAPPVDDATEVWIVEGELDCLLMLQHDFDAVTSTGGAGTWSDKWTPLFKGKKVFLAYDVDKAGREGRQKIAQHLVGVADEVRFVELPFPYHPKHGQDVTDLWKKVGSQKFAERLQLLKGQAPLSHEVEALGEADFWDQLPVLKHIHDHAKARMVSPWAVLADVLIQVVAATPPTVMLPAIIGNRVSLNPFFALVSVSGGGKSSGTAAALDCIEVPPVPRVNVGSGEGIAHQYMKRENGEVVPHTKSVIFSVGEVEHLAALSARSASTLLPELRKAWTGEELGFAYVDEKKRLPVPRHSYRLCLSVGVQPDKAAGLMDDAGGGTPQRFVWLPTEDPDMDRDKVPDEPGPRGWRTPEWPHYDKPYVMEVCEAARDLILDSHVARNQGNLEALDGHALLCREKVAAALAILDGSTAITDQYWDLSGTLMGVSQRTRDSVVAALAKIAADSNRARGQAEATRAVMTHEAVEDSRLSRLTLRLANLVKEHEAPRITSSDLRRKVAQRDRELFEEAAERAVEARLITRHKSERGTAYSLGSS